MWKRAGGLDKIFSLGKFQTSALYICAFLAMTWLAAGTAQAGNAGDDLGTWQQGQLIGAEQLASILSASKSDKPVIFCVAPNVLFRAGHIPGAIRSGPSSQPEALENLQKQAQSLAKDKEIVIYCGCCPWQHCPNVRPAYELLKKMGFSKVRVLHIPANFKQDWADKGYPVARGEQ
jgi:thiosulfate/3-mercaptopyruvate sulfurtransferase